MVSLLSNSLAWSIFVLAGGIIIVSGPPPSYSHCDLIIFGFVFGRGRGGGDASCSSRYHLILWRKQFVFVLLTLDGGWACGRATGVFQPVLLKARPSPQPVSSAVVAPSLLPLAAAAPSSPQLAAASAACPRTRIRKNLAVVHACVK